MSPGTVTDRARSSYLCCSEMIGATTGTGALVANQTLTTTGAVSEGSVTVTGAATLGGNVTTTGNQSYTGAVTLNAPAVTFTGAAPTFTNGVVGAGNDLTLSFTATTTVDGATFTGIKNLTSNNGGTTN